MNQYLINEMGKRLIDTEKISFLKNYLMVEGFDCSICENLESTKFEGKSFDLDQMLYAIAVSENDVPIPKTNIVDNYLLDCLYYQENKYTKIDFNNLFYLLDLIGIEKSTYELILNKFDREISIDTLIYIKMIQDQLKDHLKLFETMPYLRDHLLHRMVSYLMCFPSADIDELIKEFESSEDIEDFTYHLSETVKSHFKTIYPIYKNKIEEPIVFFDGVEEIPFIDDITCESKDAIYLDDTLCYAIMDRMLKADDEYLIEKIITAENQDEACFILYLAYAYPEKIKTLMEIINLSFKMPPDNQTNYTSLMLLLFSDKNLDEFLVNCAKTNVLHDLTAPFYMCLGSKNPKTTDLEIAKMKKDIYLLLDALFCA